ncbi:MAG TPA: hypothetical protein VJU59_50980 [Paraburkholderia sp.]|uniref:hypothetical protein n=1 Tax=Paraburkholderia sp. TaxID=1926495 RepID=UPI002B495C5F|nr:hypothetical protein [Paraburkholderia sp.]HKR47907.1 hypothetical protein [Paraburkholderia sp.]
MLSPHEFATLILVKDAPDQIHMVRAELETLLKRKLVVLERFASGRLGPRLTRAGQSVLLAVGRRR